MNLAACKQKQSKPVRHFGFTFAAVGLALLVVIGATNSNAQVSNNRKTWKAYEINVEGKIYDVEAPDADTAGSWANKIQEELSNRTYKHQYTPEQIFNALRAADKAGNTEDARKLAQLYKLVTSSTIATAPEEATAPATAADKSSIRTAFNPKTGEKIVLVDGEWQKYTSSATGPNGAKAFLVGGYWVIVDDRGASSGTSKVIPPIEEQLGRGSVPPKSTTDDNKKNALTEYMRTGGVQADFFGAAIVSAFGALAAALLYRLVRGSWSGTASTKVRRWAAWGAAWGGFFGISKIAQSILWSNRDDLFQGLFIIVVFTPVLAGAGVFLAKFLPTRADGTKTIIETLDPSSNAPSEPEPLVNSSNPDQAVHSSTSAVSNRMSNGGLTDQQMERLEKIASLRDRGILTDQEFAAEKEIILGVTPSRGAT